MNKGVVGIILALLSIQTLQPLKTLLDGIFPIKKKPIHGSLPYRHLNYPVAQDCRPLASYDLRAFYHGDAVARPRLEAARGGDR